MVLSKELKNKWQKVKPDPAISRKVTGNLRFPLTKLIMDVLIF